MDQNPFVSMSSFPKFNLWSKPGNRRVPLSFELVITARCNNDCRHCYINLPAGDMDARQKELTLAEISDLADQAVELGTLWVLISGGEPLLRKDFADIYMLLKRKGLLISVFTNACLVTEEHIELFRKYPPRDLEVTVYGITQETYERVTRRPGSYEAFRRGLGLLLNARLKVRLKAMAIRSNVEELPAIAAFCRQHTTDYFRFDPLLHLRYDQDPQRNREIKAERLSPEEIVWVEQGDEDRARGLEKNCDALIRPEFINGPSDRLFYCGAGNSSFAVSYDGIFHLCSDLWHPDTIYDLRRGNLAQAWNDLVPRVRALAPINSVYHERCGRCPIINLCLYCPAHAHLECGQMDGWSEYFCQVAHARAEKISAAHLEFKASSSLIPFDEA
jgi:radical SAM protein with 4Fe4S-binding SPASM domain